MNKDSDIYLDENYIPKLMEDVVDEQLKYRLSHELYTYAKRALFYKRLFYLLSISTIVLPALVTMVSVFSTATLTVDRVIIAIVSAFSSIAAGVLGIANVRENWMNYRNNCELLKEEILKYVKHYAPYNKEEDSDNEQAFVTQIFNLYHNETLAWKKSNFKAK